MSAPDDAVWREAFDERSVALDGGHLHWTGATSGRGTPVLAVANQVHTAYRLSFTWHHGREPEGNVSPACGFPGCVAGPHLQDRVLRERSSA